MERTFSKPTKDFQASNNQSLLFCEPAIAETGLWCELNEELDPEEWATLCKHIGSLNSKQFAKATKKIIASPNTPWQRFKRNFTFNQDDYADLPLVNRTRT